MITLEWTVDLYYHIWNLLTFNFCCDNVNDVSRPSQRWPQGKKYSLTYQWSIFIEKTGLSKWISKRTGHGTLKSLVAHHGWPNSSIAKTVIFWPWWQSFNSFYFETGEAMPCPSPCLLCAWLWKMKCAK